MWVCIAFLVTIIASPVFGALVVAEAIKATTQLPN